MVRKKPRWSKTNVPWETKKVIWLQLAKGNTTESVKAYLELKQDVHPGVPFSTDTIAKVRTELSALPSDMAQELVNQLPEIRTYLEDLQPHLKEKLQPQPTRGVEQPPSERSKLLEQLQISSETQKIKRTISWLQSFQRLKPWIFYYARTLSGRFNRPAHWSWNVSNYRDALPQLEDIFAIVVYDERTGQPIRGTGFADTDITEYPIDPGSVRRSLERGLELLERIDFEGQVTKVPALFDIVSNGVADNIGIPRSITRGIGELQSFEKTCEERRDELRATGRGVYLPCIIDASAKNVTLRYSLRSIGAQALKLLIAVDADIDRLGHTLRELEHSVSQDSGAL
ncbi:MAG: hypothetical protein HY669_00535 [Chloroflexi bacterium]|nr:hypothetical protein [Chloroflexota bacterium]